MVSFLNAAESVIPISPMGTVAMVEASIKATVRNKVLKATDIVTVEITVTVPLDTSIAFFPVSGPHSNGLGTVIR